MRPRVLLSAALVVAVTAGSLEAQRQRGVGRVVVDRDTILVGVQDDGLVSVYVPTRGKALLQVRASLLRRWLDAAGEEIGRAAKDPTLRVTPLEADGALLVGTRLKGTATVYEVVLVSTGGVDPAELVLPPEKFDVLLSALRQAVTVSAESRTEPGGADTASSRFGAVCVRTQTPLDSGTARPLLRVLRHRVADHFGSMERLAHGVRIAARVTPGGTLDSMRVVESGGSFGQDGVAAAALDAVSEGGVLKRVAGVLSNPVTIEAGFGTACEAADFIAARHQQIFYSDVQTDRVAYPTERVVPRYPGDLRGTGVGGRVIIDVVVRPDGRADMSTAKAVESPDARLTEAALTALRKWRFEPAQIAGKSVSMLVRIPFTFTAR